MAPRPETVAAQRHVVLIIIRGIALVMGVLAVPAIAHAVTQSLAWGGFPRSLFVFYGEGFSWASFAIGMVVPSIVLAVASKRIAAWIVPAPRFGCLRCGQRLDDGAVRCPECGTPARSEPPTAQPSG